MLDEWIELPFQEAVLLNPATPLTKGVVYPFVEMSAISPGLRNVSGSELRGFSGGGSRFRNRDTLMARITPCLENGKVARFHGATDAPVGHGSTEFIVVRGRPGVTDNDYAYYLTSSPEVRAFAISQMTGTSGRQRVPTNALGGIPVLLPPLKEQKTIAAILGSLDDKIELNRRMNATLERMARALFQSWFVDFDPVRAKLDGRQPVGMDEATATLFPDQFMRHRHGSLPVGWHRTSILEICAINAWTLGKMDDLEVIEYVEISEANRGDIANVTTYARGHEPSRARRRLRHGDTVLSTVRPDRGSHFLALNPPENRVASTGFAVLTPTNAPWSFVYAAITQTEVSDHLGQLADGGAYPAVRPEIIGALKFALPGDPRVLEAFHRICAPLFEQAAANRSQSRTLAALRDALLPRLLSGDLHLPVQKAHA